MSVRSLPGDLVHIAITAKDLIKDLLEIVRDISSEMEVKSSVVSK